MHHRYDRLVFTVDGGELRYRDLRKLRGLWLLPVGGAINDISGPQGPDALGLPLESLRQVFEGRRAIKVLLLLDQSAIAGLGNMSSTRRCGAATSIRPARRTRFTLSTWPVSTRP